MNIRLTFPYFPNKKEGVWSFYVQHNLYNMTEDP